MVHGLHISNHVLQPITVLRVSVLHSSQRAKPDVFSAQATLIAKSVCVVGGAAALTNSVEPVAATSSYFLSSC